MRGWKRVIGRGKAVVSGSWGVCQGIWVVKNSESEIWPLCSGIGTCHFHGVSEISAPKPKFNVNFTVIKINIKHKSIKIFVP